MDTVDDRNDDDVDTVDEAVVEGIVRANFLLDDDSVSSVVKSIIGSELWSNSNWA